MGVIVNGARTFLNLLAKACKLSHKPGFTTGVSVILGPETATALLALWYPLCVAVEGLIAQDNFYNQIDTVPEQDGDEDVVIG
jgi:hypothetical protein